MLKNNSFILIESVMMFFIACMIVFMITILSQVLVSFNEMDVQYDLLEYDIKEIYQ